MVRKPKTFHVSQFPRRDLKRGILGKIWEEPTRPSSTAAVLNYFPINHWSSRKLENSFYTHQHVVLHRIETKETKISTSELCEKWMERPSMRKIPLLSTVLGHCLVSKNKYTIVIPLMKKIPNIFGSLVRAPGTIRKSIRSARDRLTVQARKIGLCMYHLYTCTCISPSDLQTVRQFDSWLQSSARKK